MSFLPDFQIKEGHFRFGRLAVGSRLTAEEIERVRETVTAYVADGGLLIAVSLANVFWAEPQQVAELAALLAEMNSHAAAHGGAVVACDPSAAVTREFMFHAGKLQLRVFRTLDEAVKFLATLDGAAGKTEWSVPADAPGLSVFVCRPAECPDARLLSPVGRLTADSVAELETALADQRRDGTCDFIIDLCGLAGVDEMGVGFLVRIADDLRASGAMVAVIDVRPPVLNTIVRLGAFPILSPALNLPAAIRRLGYLRNPDIDAADQIVSFHPAPALGMASAEPAGEACGVESDVDFVAEVAECVSVSGDFSTAGFAMPMPSAPPIFEPEAEPEELAEAVPIADEVAEALAADIAEAAWKASLRPIGPSEILRRQTTVRYFRQMNPMACFPLLVLLAQAKVERIVQKHVAQVCGEGIAVRAEQPLVSIVPRFPGCLVVPDRLEVDVCPASVEAQFFVMPHAAGDFAHARVEIWYEGRLIDTIATPTRVTTQLIARAAVLSGALNPLIFGLLEGMGIDPRKQMGQAGPLMQMASDYFGGSLLMLGMACVGLFGAVAAAFYWRNRPRRADPVEKFLAWSSEPAGGEIGNCVDEKSAG